MKSFKLQVASLKTFYSEIQSLVEQKLWIKVIIGMILGIAGGAIISPAAGIVPETISSKIGSWAGLPGTIFLQIVQMIMIPLILTSIVQGIIGSGSLEQLRKMAVQFSFTSSLLLQLPLQLEFHFLTLLSQVPDSQSLVQVSHQQMFHWMRKLKYKPIFRLWLDN